MKRLLTYLSIGLVALKIVVWFTDNKLKDSLNSTFETADHRQSQIDSLKTLRIKLEQGTNLESLDSAVIQKIKNEERRLLKMSLGQYLDAKTKIEDQLKTLDTIESIVDALMLLTIGTLIFYLKRPR